MYYKYKAVFYTFNFEFAFSSNIKRKKEKMNEIHRFTRKEKKVLLLFFPL